MQKRYWITLLFISVLVIAAVNAHAAAGSMVLNNAEVCTNKPTVTLNTNFNNLQLQCCQFYASEGLNNPNPQWKTVKINNNAFQLSNPGNYGGRTVYMMYRCAIDPTRKSCLNDFSQASVTTLMDRIEYRSSCSDPKLTGFSCTPINLHEPFTFDASCKVSVTTEKISNPKDLSIDIAVLPMSGGTALTTQSLAYENGDVMLPISIPSQAGEPAQGVDIVAKIVPKPGTKLDDGNLQNNSMSQRIRVEKKSVNTTYPISECTGPVGARGDETGPVEKRWIIADRSTLTLHDCGVARPLNETKCDSSPMIPGAGERGVKWVSPPAMNSAWRVHWWCEPFSNKRESGTYSFHFEVRYEYIELKVK